MRGSFSHKFVALLVIAIGLFTTNISPATAQYGGSYANVSAPPYPGYDTPQTKLSGTKCAAGGYASSTGSPIVEAKFYLNDELVKTWTVPSGQTNYGIGLSCQYDSTHFNDGTSIVVKMTVKLADGKTFQDTGTIGTVYNRAVAFGAYFYEPGFGVFTSGAGHAAIHLNTMKHTVNFKENGGSGSLFNWTTQNLVQNTASSTALHISSHGNRTPSISFTRTSDYIFPSDFTRASGVPPMNIALLLSCSVSAGYPSNPNANEFANYLLAGGTQVNQACIAFRESVPLSHYAGLADAFWGALASGKTAHEARDAMCMVAFGNPIDDNNDGIADRNRGEDHAACWGDYFATLHRLYTGTDQAASGWWYN